MLRNLVNATIGFERLAAATKIPSKSLQRMLSPRGNPSTENFFGMVSALQKKTRVKLRVTAPES
jgi:DNA-binding phage protein